jgi:hypothetical protein
VRAGEPLVLVVGSPGENPSHWNHSAPGLEASQPWVAGQQPASKCVVSRAGHVLSFSVQLRAEQPGIPSAALLPPFPWASIPTRALATKPC